MIAGVEHWYRLSAIVSNKTCSNHAFLSTFGEKSLFSPRNRNDANDEPHVSSARLQASIKMTVSRTQAANNPHALDSNFRGSRGISFTNWVAGVSAKRAAVMSPPAPPYPPSSAGTLLDEATLSLVFFFEAWAARSVILSTTSLAAFRPASLSGSKLNLRQRAW